MKKKFFLRRMVSALFLCVILLSILSLTAYAADVPGGMENPATADEPDPGIVTPTEPEDDDDDWTSPPPDATSTYIEPTHLNELPSVKEGEVVVATAIAVPQAEVSDASLFSGIIMWLCVAVGIAVVVGVMVSRRTRRRGG